MPTFADVAHLALSVHDIDASVEWYERVLGLKKVLDLDTENYRKSILVNPENSGLKIAIVEHAATEDANFDETRVGLDHLSLRVAESTEVDSWRQWFADNGVTHSPDAPGAVPGSRVLVFRDPDNIQLEIFWEPVR